MSPEEAKLLAGLFERIKANATAPRDKEAENFIAEQVKAQPEAPYLLAQTVIVQDFALRSANERIQQLEGRVRELESQSKPSGGFLGGLFGGAAAPQPPPPRPAPPPQGYAPPQGGPWGAPPQGYGQPGYGPPGGFGQGGFGQGGFSGAPAAPGGGFLKGALGTAAGVAGGVLLADSIRGLFHGGGLGSGLGIDSGFQHAGLNETTVVNNYYGDSGGGADYPGDASYDGPNDDSPGAQDADWDSGDYDDGGGDGGFDA
jgi:uncharacterized protein